MDDFLLLDARLRKPETEDWKDFFEASEGVLEVDTWKLEEV